MIWASNVERMQENTYKFWWEACRNEAPHTRLNITWDYNIEIDFKEIGCQRAE